ASAADEPGQLVPAEVVSAEQVVAPGNCDAQAHGQRDHAGVEHEWLGVWISVVLDAVELALEDREDDRTADDEQQDDQADGGGSMVEEANDRQPPETNLAGLC